MRNELSANSVAVDSELNSDFISILDSKDCEMTPFMNSSGKNKIKLFGLKTWNTISSYDH